MKKLLAFVLMLTFALVLVGCTGKNTEPTGVEISGLTSVEVGKTIQLTATVKPSGADQKVTWSSVDASKASVDATGKVTGNASGGTVIRATTANGVVGQHRITISEQSTVSYPNLNGYTIKIAHQVPAESNPFSDLYVQPDKEHRKQAWNEVERLYNVKFQVEIYDPSYAWGPPRWQYIIDQATNKTTEYDFMSVPDDRIGTFVESKVLHDTSKWYTQYGNGFLADIYKTSGTYKKGLYSIIDGEAGINNVMYYNVNLVNDLIASGHLDKTPAEIFNDGNWTYSAFKDYAIAAQTGLESKFAADPADVYAVSGYATYYWIGMVDSSGKGLVNSIDYTSHFTDEVPQQAADTLKAIAEGGAMRPGRTVDGISVASMANSFTKGRGIFDSGDMWFVGESTRWPDDMWSPESPEDTNYGYVPFPRPDGAEYTKENHKIGLGGTATYVMPVGREHAYAGFGIEDPENIYRAFTETFLLTEKYILVDDNYDKDIALSDFADRKTGSQDSKEALLYMATSMRDRAFFDPMSLPTNPIANVWSHGFGIDFHNFVVGADAAKESFLEAITPYLTELQENLTKAYN